MEILAHGVAREVSMKKEEGEEGRGRKEKKERKDSREMREMRQGGVIVREDEDDDGPA